MITFKIVVEERNCILNVGLCVVKDESLNPTEIESNFSEDIHKKMEKVIDELSQFKTEPSTIKTKWSNTDIPPVEDMRRQIFNN